MRNTFLRSALFVALLVIVLLATCAPSLAQETVVQPQRHGEMRPDIRERLLVRDTSLVIQSRPVQRGRIDPETGVTRARYRIDEPVLAEGTPGETARRYLVERSSEYGFRSDAADLELEAEVVRPRSAHVTFRQTAGGLPVYGASVRVNLSADGRPSMVISSYRPHVAAAAIPEAWLDATDAIQRVADVAGVAVTVVGEATLLVYPSEEPQVAWHVIARPPSDAAEWSIFVNAVDGEIIEWSDQGAHVRASADIDLAGPERSDRAAIQAAATVDGSGSVFDPDPLTRAGVGYGTPFVDANDAEVPELNAQRVEVTLRDITRGTDGRHRLEGPYVRIVGDETIGLAYEPPRPYEADGFHYGRGNDFFEAVNAYYHIDKSQRYVQQLDPALSIHRHAVLVNPHGLGPADDSEYRPSSNAILFGTGGVDDAEDADVIWHEYAHALLQASVPGLLAPNMGWEGLVLHEGWADYWAASYSRHLIESGEVPSSDWRKVYTWDGNESWNGRRLDHPGKYPADTPCVRVMEEDEVCHIHTDGLVWATSLMEIYSVIGRESTDYLNLLSHGYIVAPTTLRDAAEAVVQADLDYLDGAHLSTLLEVFRRRGLVDSLAFGPQITHHPPQTTEQVGGELLFEVEIQSNAEVETVALVLLDGDAPRRQMFASTAEGAYELDAILPTDVERLAYYIEAVDVDNRRVLLPSGAPAEQFTLVLGPDVEPPVISHDPPVQINLVDWPARISAEVMDRLPLDSVWVEFEVEGDAGTGAFGLTRSGSSFSGFFPDIDLKSGDRISYRILARDSAADPNVGVMPDPGVYLLDVTSGTLIRQFTFEGETGAGVEAVGAWERGVPSYGLQFAREGTTAWGTRLDTTYPNETGQSTITLPPVRLRAFGEAYLVFWHWFDTEHDGTAAPERRDGRAFIWDGGNVKISSDGGESWQLAEPVDGYIGTISAKYGNPLGGQLGFGGYSRGWRREVIPLPDAAEVAVRFDFGTDDGNQEAARFYAGWFVDDVRIVSEIPQDDEAPNFTAPPPRMVTAASGGFPAPISVEIEDETGVSDVWMTYALYDEGRALVESDTFFLEMSVNSATTFSGGFQTVETPSPGYSVDYTLFASDFDGNIVSDAAGGAGYRIEYLYQERHSLLSDLRYTGLWARSGDRWLVRPSDAPSTRSSLLMGPFDLPSDVAAMRIILDHSYDLGEGLGGNLKVSTNDGRTWRVVEPDEQYPSSFGTDDHPMAGEGAFAGGRSDSVTSVFGLQEFLGQQVRVRIDFGASRSPEPEEGWTIHSALLALDALEEEPEVPRELRLHSNYPDPFSTTTAISYTVAEEDAVLLEVYDVLGRRVDVLVWAVLPPGTYSMTYDGSRLPSGVYFLRMTSGGNQQVQQMVVAR